MRSALAAVAFLTRVPVGVRVTGDDVVRGAVFFPLVGAAIGAVVAGFALLLHPTLSPLLASALAVGAGVVLTGALHVDALADTLDATGASTRARALEIMRDSRIGSYGAAAIAIDLLVRTAAIEQLLVRGGVLQALIASAALSRASSVVLSSILPYARAEGGTGSVLSGRVSPLAAVVLALAIAAVALRIDAFAVVGAVVATTAVLGVVYRAWLGGVTGDALGAATEASELVALVVAAALA